MQQGSRQQVRVGLPAVFQVLEQVVGMQLFGSLHAAKEDELYRREVGKQALACDGFAGVEHGVPELAGAVGQAGYHHGVNPAERRWEDYNIVLES